MSHVILRTSLKLDDFARDFFKLRTQHPELRSFWHTTENQALIEVSEQGQDFFLSMHFLEHGELKLNLHQSSEVQGNHHYQKSLKALAEWILTQVSETQVMTHTLGYYAPTS